MLTRPPAQGLTFISSLCFSSQTFSRKETLSWSPPLLEIFLPWRRRAHPPGMPRPPLLLCCARRSTPKPNLDFVCKNKNYRVYMCTPMSYAGSAPAAHFLGLCMAVLCFSGYCLNFWSAWRLPFLFGKKVSDNSLVFASHSCRAWFLYVCFPGAYKISAVMQGAPPDQMGASYPHMFLILLLLHGANAASKAPAGPKWQTLSGILFLFFFFCRYPYTYQDFQAF